MSVPDQHTPQGPEEGQEQAVMAELVTGIKLEVDLEYASVASAEEFYQRVESGQLRWVKTKAELPSLLNLWHVVRFEVKNVELPPLHLRAAQPDESGPPRFQR